MKITFLGTAAAEGMPAVFCNCDACKKAKAKRGKNIRTRSQILIDEKLLLDFPQDTYAHVLNNSLDLSKIENVFITHAHNDHCCPADLCLRGEPFAHGMAASRLTVYGNKTVIERSRVITATELKPEIEKNIEFKSLKPYDAIALADYNVTALPAVHTENEDCFIYLVKDKSGKTFLMFNDSGVLPDSVYEYLRDAGEKLDAVAFDCTYGYAKSGPHRHMGALDNVSERGRMKAFGLTREKTKYYLTHFSHNGGLLHGELNKKVKGLSLIPAYDGLKVEI